MTTQYVVQVSGAVTVNAANFEAAMALVEASGLQITAENNDAGLQVLPTEWNGKQQLRATTAKPVLNPSDVDTLGD